MSNQDPLCKGKKLGHNFLVPGGPCMNGCGITQADLSRQMRPIAPKRAVVAPQPAKDEYKTIHTQIHMLAKDISEFCGEPKKFGMYLGVIKRIGKDQAYYLFSLLKDPRNTIKTPGRWFMWKAKSQPNNANKTTVTKSI